MWTFDHLKYTYHSHEHGLEQMVPKSAVWHSSSLYDNHITPIIITDITGRHNVRIQYPWATGLCFIKVCLVTLIGLTDSLSIYNSSEMINVHVFLIKAANSLLLSHPGPPAKNLWCLDSNSLSRRYVQQIKNGALVHTVQSLSLLIIHSLILLAIQSSSWEVSYGQDY